MCSNLKLSIFISNHHDSFLHNMCSFGLFEYQHIKQNHSIFYNVLRSLMAHLVLYLRANFKNFDVFNFWVEKN